jgi:hypothetical protein
MSERREIEVFGVNYERFALGNLLKKLSNAFQIETVAELPAHGAKAMPSIYSLGFGLANKNVTLVNGVEQYKKEWAKLGLDHLVKFVFQDDIAHTNFVDNSFDFVWNFAYIPLAQDKDALVEEMKRISKKYVALFSVNGGNVGYHIHSTLHKKNGIPWTHGDKGMNKRKNVEQLLEMHDLQIVKKGFVDCPVWPDSLGFRDMRLHRNNITFDNVEWVSPFVDMLKNDTIPRWMRGMYIWESIPMIPVVKTIYSHLFYVIGEKHA